MEYFFILVAVLLVIFYTLLGNLPTVKRLTREQAINYLGLPDSEADRLAGGVVKIDGERFFLDYEPLPRKNPNSNYIGGLGYIKPDDLPKLPSNPKAFLIPARGTNIEEKANKLWNQYLEEKTVGFWEAYDELIKTAKKNKISNENFLSRKNR